MRIALIEPYDTGSHHDWLHGYAAHSRHHIVPLTLKGQFWKWRMHGGAVTLARRYREHFGSGSDERAPSALLATDMLDLTTFLALTRDLTHGLPVALYMHENQLTYPTRPGEKRDLHYGFINYTSMLCADRIYFNSRFHLEGWFDELPRLLKHFPDHNELGTVQRLRERSEVLPLGLSLSRLDDLRPAQRPPGPPIVLWNHRWEYDKDPGAFLRALYALQDRDISFSVALLGETFVRVPPEFDEARERLGDRLVQFGYVDAYAEYVRWLWWSDVVVSTAIHDFFGASMAEAIYCGCHPILPNRLNYPTFVPEAERPRCLYDDHEGLCDLLAEAIQHASLRRNLREVVAVYDWDAIAPLYDKALAPEVLTGRD